MNTVQKLGVSCLVMVGAVAGTSGLVSAEMYQEQSQNVSNSHSFTVKCDGGSCTSSSSGSGGATGEFKFESEVNQHQYQSNDMESHSIRSKSYYNSNSDTFKKNRGIRKNVSTAGKVDIGWDYEGGTCNIRYTENTSQQYRYSTSAGCDEGGVTIGGLRPGRSYRFQVQKDNGAWSEPIVMIARR